MSRSAAAPTASVLTFLREQIVSSDTFANLTVALNGQAASASGANGASVADAAQGIALPASYNPAESIASSASGSGAAVVSTASGAAANVASLVQVTNPAIAGITPTLHGS